MGVHFLGEITIGGPIPRDLLPELVKLLDHAGLLPDGNDLRKYLDDGHLFFRDAEASYGCFRALEDFLQHYGIEFNRWSEGSYEYEPEMVVFRKETGLRQWPTDRDGHRVVQASEVQKLLKHEGIKEARRKACKLLGPEVPPLKKIKPEELVLPQEQEASKEPPQGKARTFKVDVNLAQLLDAGVIRPGPKWPEAYPPKEVNFWIAVFIQENPKDKEACLAETSAYLSGGDHGPHDLGVNPDAAFEATSDDQPMPWRKPFYGGPS